MNIMLLDLQHCNGITWCLIHFLLFYLGSAALTSLFEGENEHRVPSAAAMLRESHLFEMAGRMIGHSFLHGGLGLTGLSLPVVTLLTGGSMDTAASALTLLDCPDLDYRETIGFVSILVTS